MSKVLYPKSHSVVAKRAVQQESLTDRPYHVQYYDPENPTSTPEWRYYNSELAVKVGSWYNCVLLGFNSGAVLYSRDEIVAAGVLQLEQSSTVQTFLTDLPNVGYGLNKLDQKRLVKQLLETRQIMAALTGALKGWVNHPATKMWRGKEDMLFDYAEQNAMELARREYKWENNFKHMALYYHIITDFRTTNNVWDSNDYKKVIYTHRGRLHEKDPEYYASWEIYSDFRKHTCCNHCDYYWPSHVWEREL